VTEHSDATEDREDFGAAVNDELLLLEHGAGFDDTTALEHERNAVEAEKKARALAVLRRHGRGARRACRRW
jgi:hypothetical protein